MMSNNRKIIILILILGSSWCMAIPYHGFMWSSLVSRYAVNSNSAQILLICLHYIALFSFSFLINVHNVKRMLGLGLASSLALSTLMWYLPVTQAYYAAYALLGATTGLLYAGICVMFIYGFTNETRIKVTALYLFGMYSLTYGLSYILKLLNPSFAFNLLSLLIIAALYLLAKFDPLELVAPDSIPDSPLPVKMLLLLGFILLLGYFNSGLIVTNVYNFYGSPLVKQPHIRFEQFYLLAAYLVFYFLGSKINRFVILYFSFIFIGLTYLFCILLNSDNTAASTASVVSSSFFHLFTFSFVADIALKYGRTLKVLRASLLVVAIGAISGELIGKAAGIILGGNYILLFGISLAVLLLSLMLVPWLAKYITNELEQGEVPSPGTVINTSNESKLTAQKPDIFLLINDSLEEKGRLTARELEVAEYLLERYDYDTISEKLCISKNTLKVHAKRIYQKLQVSGRKELIELASRMVKSSSL